jgi:hypothetical protein
MIDINRMHSTLYTFSMLVSPSPTSLNTPNFPSSHQHLSPLSLASSAVVRSNGDVQAHSTVQVYGVRSTYYMVGKRLVTLGTAYVSRPMPAQSPSTTPGQPPFSLGTPSIRTKGPVQASTGGIIIVHRLFAEDRALSFSWYPNLSPFASEDTTREPYTDNYCLRDLLVNLVLFARLGPNIQKAGRIKL